MPTCPTGHTSATDDYCCGAPRVGRFCEECGHDSLAAAPRPGSGSGPTGGRARAGWFVTVEADEEHYRRVLAANGPDAADIVFPRFCPPRRFPLVGSRVLIGRRSRSRGIQPGVDLVGPPEDPGVSHHHALLLASGDGWSVVDLGSTNGTTVNGGSTPLEANAPWPLAEGDRVHVGVWTTITLRRS